MASENSLALKPFLMDSVEALSESQVPKFLAHVFKALVEIKEEGKVVDMMYRSGLLLEDLMSPEKVPQFASQWVIYFVFI